MISLITFKQVGAGPAGLTAALTLVQNGISVRIIDKSDAFHIGTRGNGLQARDFLILSCLILGSSSVNAIRTATLA